MAAFVNACRAIVALLIMSFICFSLESLTANSKIKFEFLSNIAISLDLVELVIENFIQTEHQNEQTIN